MRWVQDGFYVDLGEILGGGGVVGNYGCLELYSIPHRGAQNGPSDLHAKKAHKPTCIVFWPSSNVAAGAVALIVVVIAASPVPIRPSPSHRRFYT